MTAPSSGGTNPRALRIAHLNSLLTGGGTDDQCVKLAHGLAQLGQKVWVLGPNGRELEKVIRELKVPFEATPPEGPLKSRFILSVARHIRHLRIQIVHAHHGRDLWPCILAARLSGRRPRILVTRHLAKSPSSWFSRRFLLGQCDAVIAVSQFVAKVLREGVYEPNSPEPERRARPPLRGELSKIRVVHGGIDTERFKPAETSALRRTWNLSSEHYVFGAVGGYDLPRGKGQREFLQAAVQVKDKLPHARFLIIGRGNLREILQQDIAQLGLAGRAMLTPYCRDMPEAMNALDCLVHAQVGTDAFPGVILEAFACGKPVIASALDGIPEGFAIGQEGRLVPAEDIAALAVALLEQAARPPLTMDARHALHNRVANECSLPQYARKVLEVYHQLTGLRCA